MPVEGSFLGEARTLPALLRQRTEATPGKAVVVTADETLTYGDLDRRSAAVAGRFLQRGMTKGTRVGLLLPNGIEWVVASVAALRIGATLVPLSTLLRPPELAEQLRTADVAQLVLATEFRGRHYHEELAQIADGFDSATGTVDRRPDLPMLQVVWRPDDLGLAVSEPDAVEPLDRALLVALEDAVRPSDDLAVMFTSGSRGSPKGVIHTHGGALRATEAGLPARCVGVDERLYIPMPFFWMGGFGGGLLTVLVAGATLVTEAVPEPATTLRLLERERVTLFRGWPDQAAQLAAHPDRASTDLSSLGPGSLPALLPDDARPAPGARANLFGMTESFGPYCGARLDLDLPASAWGSCGRPFEGVEVRIVDPDDGTVRSSGEQGVIELRGPNLLRGICGRLREDVFTVDGFFSTGDLGHLDADGYLFFGGRVDDMFKVKGATVYPTEVESALRSLPRVRLALVTDLVDEHGVAEVGVAVLTDPADPVDAGSLADGARDRLSSFKVPTRWLLLTSIDEVARSATGKVDKAALQDQIRTQGERPGRRPQ